MQPGSPSPESVVGFPDVPGRRGPSCLSHRAASGCGLSGALTMWSLWLQTQGLSLWAGFPELASGSFPVLGS